jgi:hypothetical protein
MNDDLVAFLRDRLAEDERIARAATPGPWRYNPDKHWRRPGTSWVEEAVFAGPSGAGATCVAGTGETDDPPSMTDATHIARHDPARVLAEVEAKRRAIDACMETLAGEDAWDPQLDGGSSEPYDLANHMLKTLAAPYADHHSYQPAWRL